MSRREEIVWMSGADLKIPRDGFADVLAAAADIVIAADRAGIVQNVITNARDGTLGCLDHWVGRDLKSFLTEECHPKLDAILAAVFTEPVGSSRTTEFNHVDNANWEFPIRYTAVRADDESVLLVGRDLRPIAEVQQKLIKAQLALEKDYEVYRAFDTRYRVLMAASLDAIVLLDAGTGRVEDANQAAAHLLGTATDTLAGTPFFQEFEGRRQAEFMDALTGVASSGSGRAVAATARRVDTPVNIFPTLFRAAGRPTLLCRLESGEETQPVAEELSVNLHALFNKGMDAVVFTDTRGMIRSSNESFLNLCDVATADGLQNKSLSEFLARGGADLKILIDNAARVGRMRTFSTRLETALGSQRPVEVSTTYLNDRSDPAIAFVFRDMARPAEAAPPPATGNGDVARNVMGLVGTSPLKDIVAATADVVEKLCIETAVQLTNNNRVAAAEMLGLSRQSLYVKLRKYGLLDKSASD